MTTIRNKFRRNTMSSPTSVLLSSSPSPSKALRAAVLKQRFAGIISKAADYQRANNKAYGSSPKAQLLTKKEVELLKKQRAKDRAAARKALEQVKRTVFVYEDAETLEEIERVGCLQIFSADENPLELLGLYLKKEYMEEDDEEQEQLSYTNYEDLEEGEIVS